MFCPECGNHAANKAIRTLEERGQIGRTERKEYACFAESDFQFSGGYCPEIPGKPFGDGDTVTVTWDGTSYTRTAKVFPFTDLANGFYVGNLFPLGGEDTGEPFALLSTYDDDGNFMGFIAVDVYNFNGDSTHRIGCSVFAETIHPIDQKYLPGVCLPVVEVSTTLSTGAFLTDEESAKLTEAYAAECPVVIKCDITLGTLKILYCSIIFGRGEMYGDVNAPVFYASFGSTTLTLVYMSDVGWMFQAK